MTGLLLESTISNTWGQHQLTGLYEIPISIPGLPRINLGWYRATRKCGLLRKALFPPTPLSKSLEPEVTRTYCCSSPVTLISYTFQDAST